MRRASASFAPASPPTGPAPDTLSPSARLAGAAATLLAAAINALLAPQEQLDPTSRVKFDPPRSDHGGPSRRLPTRPPAANPGTLWAFMRGAMMFVRCFGTIASPGSTM